MKKQGTTAGDGGKHEEAQTAALDRMGAIATTAELNIDTLAGDLRDTVLDIIKTRPKPWTAMSKIEQQDVVRTVEYAVRELVTKSVDVIRSEGMQDPIKAILESYNEKDGIKVSLKVKTMGEDDSLAAVTGLHRARGKLVLITMASAEDYLGQRADAAVDEDQTPLDFEAGTDAEQQDGDLTPAPVSEQEQQENDES